MPIDLAKEYVAAVVKQLAAEGRNAMVDRVENAPMRFAVRDEGHTFIVDIGKGGRATVIATDGCTVGEAATPQGLANVLCEMLDRPSPSAVRRFIAEPANIHPTSIATLEAMLHRSDPDAYGVDVELAGLIAAIGLSTLMGEPATLWYSERFECWLATVCVPQQSENGLRVLFEADTWSVELQRDYAGFIPGRCAPLRKRGG